MHDTMLLHKIDEQVQQLCIANHIQKINRLSVTVNHRSHVNEHNLLEHFKNTDSHLIGGWTKVIVNRDDIQDQTAILDSIEGEKN